MIRNYIKMAFRNLWKDKTFTMLNIAGLAIGIGVCIILFAFVNKELAFDYQFLDRHIAQLYVSEVNTARTITVFSIIAIVIACLGLFGLAAFTAEQRTKEIGMRKVLGATVTSIAQLLSKDFLKLIVIAFVIAAPLAYWLMNKWLLDFVYRTEISLWVFVFAGSAAILIALITVSFQAIKAAIANPIDSLKME